MSPSHTVASCSPATAPATPLSKDTLQAFVDHFPERVTQQITFIRNHYTQANAKKSQFSCYERFLRKDMSTFVLVPKDSAQHVYGYQPDDSPIYFYQGDSLYGGFPKTLFYQSRDNTQLIEVHDHDMAEGSYSQIEEYYFSEGQLLFVFHHYESIDYWTKHNEGLEKRAKQHRYYFLDNRPIQCIGKRYRGFDDAAEMIVHQPNTVLPLRKGLLVLRQAQALLSSTNENAADK